MSDNYITKEEILSFVEELEKRTHGDDLITKTVLVTTKCVKDFVMHMPPEDVQPVVRCKNCKHYKTTGNFKAYCDEENFPDEGQKELPEWWFCAGGKRKGADDVSDE